MNKLSSTNKYDFRDKRDENGMLLRYSAQSLAADVTQVLLEKIQGYAVYQLLVDDFKEEYLEMYFKKYFYQEFLPLAHQIVLYKWHNNHYGNSSDQIILVSEISWLNLLKEVWPAPSIHWKVSRWRSLRNLAENGLRKLYVTLRSFVRYIISSIVYKGVSVSFADDNQKSTIAVNYMEGISFGKRPDIFWFPDSDIDPSRVLIYFENSNILNRYDKAENIIKKIEDIGFKYLILSRSGKNVPHAYYKPRKPGTCLVVKEIKQKLRNCVPVDKTEKWLIKEVLKLLDRIEFWYTFFDEYKVKISYDMFEYDGENIIKNISLNLIGGCSFGKVRSYLTNGNGLIYGYYPNNIFFTWGRDSAERYLNSTNIHEHVLISGFPYGSLYNEMQEITYEIRKDLVANGTKFIVLLLDNTHSMNQSSTTQIIMTPVMSMFYEHFLQWVIDEEDVGLIIKSKRTVVQETMPNVLPLLKQAEKTGRCFNITDPHRIQPDVFAKISNFVVSIGLYLPGALLESILEGVRGVFFDYGNLQSNEQELYAWGEKKVIFNDLYEMVESIKKFKYNPLSNPDLGDWSAHLDELDPFRDMRGGERIGTYVRWLLKAFDQGLERQDAIERANVLYAEAWGEDKIYYSNGVKTD